MKQVAAILLAFIFLFYGTVSAEDKIEGNFSKTICNCGEWLRPDITWFEDMLNEDIIAQANQKVIESDLFQNISSKYDLICCDVSGVSKNIAEVTGWFPTKVPKADDTGSNLIIRVSDGSPDYLKEGGSLNICTTSFSNIQEIENTMQKSFPNKWEKILEIEVPFSKRLMANIDMLKDEMFLIKDKSYFWIFSMYKLSK